MNVRVSLLVAALFLLSMSPVGHAEQEPDMRSQLANCCAFVWIACWDSSRRRFGGACRGQESAGISCLSFDCAFRLFFCFVGMGRAVVRCGTALCSVCSLHFGSSGLCFAFWIQ